MAPTSISVRRGDPDSGSWRQFASAEDFILESWSQGFMVGALVIMACITVANMRRGVLLHKLILVEVRRSLCIETHAKEADNRASNSPRSLTVRRSRRLPPLHPTDALRHILLHVLLWVRVVSLVHRHALVLLVGRPQRRRLDEDSALLLRLQLHVQALDRQMGAKNLPRDTDLHGAADHLADLRQLPLLQQHQ